MRRRKILTLCEHKRVLWADIDICLTQPASKESFKVTCSHWGCPSLSRTEFLLSRSTMYLTHDNEYPNLTWTIHELLDINSQGRFDYSTVRAMFARHRRSCSSIFRNLEPLAEMQCFEDERRGCTCLGHERGRHRPSQPQAVARATRTA